MKIKEIRSNLQIKITLLIFILLLSISVLISVYLGISAESRAREIAKSYAYGVSKIIDSSLIYYMKQGDKREIASLIDRLSDNENILGIHIFDSKKQLSCLNTKISNLKYRNDYMEAILSSIEYQKTTKVTKTRHYVFLSYFSPYENKGECMKCHDEKGIIGVLNVNIELKKIYDSVMIQAKKTFVVMFASSIFISIILSFLINKLIIQPLRKIERAMNEVVHNNLNVKVDIHSKDELESLANNFNNMVRSLDQANKTIDKMHKSVLHTDRLMTIGKLTASISHEIKNPLNSIIISSDILLEHCKEKKEDERLKKFLESIIEDAQRIKEIIHQTLNFSRFETATHEKISVKDLIASISIYARRILFNRADIKFIVQDELPNDLYITGNRTNIEQVLINILKNAAESIQEGTKGEIYFVISHNDQFVRFRIIDNGVGISKEKLNYIFQEFYSTKPDGTGLGLAIVKEIVEEHDGRISIESEENKGTTVLIEIPYSGNEDA